MPGKQNRSLNGRRFYHRVQVATELVDSRVGRCAPPGAAVPPLVPQHKTRVFAECVSLEMPAVQVEHRAVAKDDCEGCVRTILDLHVKLDTVVGGYVQFI